jgi:hypothetical protein
MWSHYASDHQGFCLSFAADCGYFRLAQRVRYSDSFPVPSLLFDTDFVLNEKMLLAKSPEWAYEDEWRVIEYIEDGDSRSLEYPPDALEEVIFGARMSANDKAEILTALKRCGRSPLILQASVAEGEVPRAVRGTAEIGMRTVCLVPCIAARVPKMDERRYRASV